MSKKNVDPNKIKTDKKSHKNFLVYYTGYMTIKDLKYVKLNSLNSLYFIINEVNGYYQEK